MENLSLYDYIEKLKQARENLVCPPGSIRILRSYTATDSRRILDSKIEEINAKLDRISRKYAINYKKLIQIIDKQRGKKHKLKCFKEYETIWEVNEGVMSPNKSYTGRYLLGFISEDNKFYDCKENDLGYSVLKTDDYAEMIKATNETNAIVLDANDEYGYPRMFLLDLVKNKNYVQMVTHNHRYWNDFYQERVFELLDIITEELKQVEYNQENTKTTEDLSV